MHAAVIPSPIGPIYVEAEDGRLTRLFTNTAVRADAPTTGVLAETQRQLEEYFAGARTTFELPLKEDGTPFEQAVWARLRQIPYGETITYERDRAASSTALRERSGAPTAATRSRSSSRATG